MAIRGSKPIGDPAWAPFFLRMTLGLYFMALGLWGSEDLAACTAAIQKYSNIGGTLGEAYATVAPYILLASGAMLLFGLWTIAAAIGAILCLFPLLYGAGLFERPPNVMAHRNLYRDACVLGACFALLFTGGGILSLDRLMRADK